MDFNEISYTALS